MTSAAFLPADKSTPSFIWRLRQSLDFVSNYCNTQIALIECPDFLDQKICSRMGPERGHKPIIVRTHACTIGDNSSSFPRETANLRVIDELHLVNHTSTASCRYSNLTYVKRSMGQFRNAARAPGEPTYAPRRPSWQGTRVRVRP